MPTAEGWPNQLLNHSAKGQIISEQNCGALETKMGQIRKTKAHLAPSSSKSNPKDTEKTPLVFLVRNIKTQGKGIES